MKKLPSNSDLESIRLLVNNQPIDDFEGLSPTEMSELLYNPFAFTSPLYLPDELSDETLNRIPFFRLMEEFLKIIAREKSIKLTPLGYLQKKVLVELYAYDFVKSYGVERGLHKLTKEEDWPVMMTIHDLSNMLGFVRKLKGGYVLTKAGKDFIKTENRNRSFRDLFRFYTTFFSWSNLDGYSVERVGQLGWGFTLLLLKKYGNKPLSPTFYVDKYLKAFPAFVDQMTNSGFGTPYEYVANAYRNRVFSKFLVWWGFIEYTEKHFDRGTEISKIVATPLLKELFSVEE